jgi:hypothetical protein
MVDFFVMRFTGAKNEAPKNAFSVLPIPNPPSKSPFRVPETLSEEIFSSLP